MARRSRSSAAPFSLFAFQDIVTSLSGILILIVLLMSLNLVAARVEESEAHDSEQSHATIREELKRKIDSLMRELVIAQADISAVESEDPIALVRERKLMIDEIETLDAKVQEAEQIAHNLQDDAHELEEQNEQNEQKRQLLDQAVERLRQEVEELPEGQSITFIPDVRMTKDALLVECASEKIRIGRFRQQGAPVELLAGRELENRFRSLLATLDPDAVYVVFFIKPTGIDLYERLWPLILGTDLEWGFDALEEPLSIDFERST